MRWLRLRRIWVRIVLYLALGVGAYVLLCWWLARGYVSPIRAVSSPPPSAVSEELPFGAYPIPVWATPGLARGEPSANALFVLVHGYGGNRGSWADAFEELHRRGYGVVVPEMPAHGTNADPRSGFGPKEADVLLEVTRWARSRIPKGTRVVAVGLSMGGAACWLASQREPAAFDAIVSESAFADLESVQRHWFSKLLPGGTIVLAPVTWFGRKIAGVDPAHVRPVEAAAKWKGRPALVIHAAQDRLMPREHAERLAAAAGCELWEIPGAGHAEGYFVAKHEFLRRLETLARRLEGASIEPAVKAPRRGSTPDGAY
jgi:pimeloyl-ACP methyl ester carboxylesterase